MSALGKALKFLIKKPQVVLPIVILNLIIGLGLTELIEPSLVAIADAIFSIPTLSVSVTSILPYLLQVAGAELASIMLYGLLISGLTLYIAAYYTALMKPGNTLETMKTKTKDIIITIILIFLLMSLVTLVTGILALVIATIDFGSLAPIIIGLLVLFVLGLWTSIMARLFLVYPFLILKDEPPKHALEESSLYARKNFFSILTIISGLFIILAIFGELETAILIGFEDNILAQAIGPIIMGIVSAYAFLLPPAYYKKHIKR